MARFSRDELVELVRKILACEGTEEEVDEWQDLLEQNVPHPEVSDLMYFSGREMTPEEIVDEALAYRATSLPPPKR